MAQLKPSGDCLDTTATKFATKLAAVRRASAALKVREPAHDSRTADLSLEMSYLEERYPDSFERAGAGHGNDGSRDGGEELPAIGLLSDIGVNDAANESDPWLPPWQPWRAA